MKPGRIKFDPGLLESDCLKVTICADSIEAIAYPTLAPAVLGFKENIFGYWDEYTPFNKKDEVAVPVEPTVTIADDWTPPFRPFSVIVDLKVFIGYLIFNSFFSLSD